MNSDPSTAPESSPTTSWHPSRYAHCAHRPQVEPLGGRSAVRNRAPGTRAVGSSQSQQDSHRIRFRSRVHLHQLVALFLTGSSHPAPATWPRSRCSRSLAFSRGVTMLQFADSGVHAGACSHRGGRPTLVAAGLVRGACRSPPITCPTVATVITRTPLDSRRTPVLLSIHDANHHQTTPANQPETPPSRSGINQTQSCFTSVSSHRPHPALPATDRERNDTDETERNRYFVLSDEAGAWPFD